MVELVSYGVKACVYGNPKILFSASVLFGFLNLLGLVWGFGYQGFGDQGLTKNVKLCNLNRDKKRRNANHILFEIQFLVS